MDKTGVSYGSLSLIVIGIILILIAIVFYFVKNTNFFAIAVIVIGILTIILGIIVWFLDKKKKEEMVIAPVPETKKVRGKEIALLNLGKSVVNEMC